MKKIKQVKGMPRKGDRAAVLREVREGITKR